MSGLTVVQVSMALALLVGAALVGRAYDRLMNTDRGFEDRDLLVAQVTLSPSRYPATASKERFLEETFARIEAIPGVTQASSATTTPALAGSWGAVFNVEGRTPPEPRGYYLTSHRFISDDYFEIMGIPLVEGRPFDGRDHREGVHSVIISREFAERFWPAESAIGKRLRRGDPEEPLLTVVGVVEDVVEAGESDLWDKMIAWYLPTDLGSDYDFADTFLLVRTDGDLPGAGEAIRRAVWSVDPAMGVPEIEPIRTVMAKTFERQRYSAMLFGIFGVASLVIAVVGLYGFFSFQTALRRGELGIRMALGALPAQVRLRVLRDAGKLYAVGLVLALPLGLLLVSGISSVLYGVGSSGVPEMIGVSIVLGATSLLAAFAPASRAARTDPMSILRRE